MKKIIFILMGFIGLNSFALANPIVNLGINYFVTINMIGTPTANQQVTFLVKDDYGNVIVKNQPLSGNSAVLTWPSHYDDIGNGSGSLKNHNYTIYINNITAQATDKAGKSHNLGVSIPIHISEQPKNTWVKNINDVVSEIHGSLGISTSILSSKDFNLTLTDEQSSGWQQITAIKSLDSDLETNQFARGIGNTTFLNTQIDLDVTLPYVTDFVSIKNGTHTNAATIGYQFAQ